MQISSDELAELVRLTQILYDIEDEKAEDHRFCDDGIITEEERKQLYTFCEVEKNMNKFEGVIIKTFNRIAKEDEKESA